MVKQDILHEIVEKLIVEVIMVVEIVIEAEIVIEVEIVIVDETMVIITDVAVVAQDQDQDKQTYVIFNFSASKILLFDKMCKL